MARNFFCLALAACLLASTHALLPSLGGGGSVSGSVSASVNVSAGGSGGGFVGNLLGGSNGSIIGALTNPITSALNQVTNVALTLPKTVSSTLDGVSNSLTGITNGLGGLTGILGPVETLVKPATQVLGTVTDTLGSVISPISKVFKSLEGIIPNIIQTVNIESILGKLTGTIDSVTKVPLDTIGGLLDTVTTTLNPSNASSSILGALGPQLGGLSSLTKQLSGTVAAGKCLISSATATIRGSILSGVLDIAKCTTAVKNSVSKLSVEAFEGVSEGIDFTGSLVKNSTECLKKVEVSGSIGGVVSCGVNPVAQGVSFASNRLEQAKPTINKAVEAVTALPECVEKVLTSRVAAATSLLQNITKCASNLGVSVDLPNLPNVVPNITAIVSKSVAAIEKIVEAVSGSNSPVNKLFVALDKLKNIAGVINPTTIANTVNASLQAVQDVIDAAKSLSGSNNPVSLACVSNAQKALGDLVSKTVNNVVNCTASIGKNAASLAIQAAAIDIGLKTELAKAAANALTKCTGNVLSLDNTFEKCFDSAINELQIYIKDQIDKVNKALDTVNALIGDAESCLSSGVNLANNAGKLIVDQLKGCLSGQGTVVPTENTTASVNAGIESVTKLVVELGSTAEVVASLSVNVNGTVDFIASVNAEAVANVIVGSVAGAKNAVEQLEQALKDNTNPEVKKCLEGSKDRLNKLVAEASSSAITCVNSNKQKVSDVASQIAAQDKLLKEQLANAALKAQEQCSVGLTKVIVQNCFVDVSAKINADVSKVVESVQRLAESVQASANDVIQCVNEGAARVTERADNELASLSSCLGAQGITVTISRS